jgi:hypothetical protein
LQRNALSIYILALYFRLSGLKTAAEATFTKLDRQNSLQILQQVSDAAGPLVPRQIVDFLSGSFHQLVGNDLFTDLPRSLVFQVLDSAHLRISSERQLIESPIVLHTKSPLSRESTAQYTGVVQWKNLDDADWDAVNWRLFIVEDKRDRSVKLRKQVAGCDVRFGMVLLALTDPEPRNAVAALARYVPPRTSFGFGDDFFANAGRDGSTKDS